MRVPPETVMMEKPGMDKPGQPPGDRDDGNAVLRATVWMLGGLLSLAALAVGGRELSSEMSIFQFLFLRSIIGTAIVAIAILATQRAQFRSRQPGLHALRNIAHISAQYGWFYGLAVLPLAEVFAIEFTTPLWTLLFSVLLLGERLTRPRLLAILCGFSGILVIVQPGVRTPDLASFAVLLAAIGFAMTYVATKRLTRKESVLTVLFYMTLMQTALSAIPALSGWRMPSLEALPWIGLTAVTALSAHYCMTKALQLADAAVVIPIDFLRLPLIAVVGLIFYGESLEFAVLVGAVLIFLGNFNMVYLESRQKPAARPPS